jgi:hypothetical protein
MPLSLSRRRLIDKGLPLFLSFQIERTTIAGGVPRTRSVLSAWRAPRKGERGERLGERISLFFSPLDALPPLIFFFFF